LDAGLVSLVVIAVLNSLVSVYYYLRVVVAMYMKSERKPTMGVLETLAPRSHALEGPGAMAAEAEEAPVAPRLAETPSAAAKLTVAICVLMTLWLGMGPDLGRIPGLTRIMEWAEAAVATLR
jgi:hypothetical protein